MKFLRYSTTNEALTLRRSGWKTSRPAQAFVGLLTLVAAAFLFGCGGGDGEAASAEDPAAEDASPAQPPGTESSGSDTTAAEPSGRTARTVSGYAACTSLPKFHEMMGHVAAEETEAYRAMLEDSGSGCFMLKGDVDVVLVRGTPTFVEIRPPGTESTVWTVPEALDIEGQEPPADSAAPDSASAPSSTAGVSAARSPATIPPPTVGPPGAGAGTPTIDAATASAGTSVVDAA